VPVYRYRARDKDGKKEEGLMPAKNKKDLASILKKEGQLLVFAIPEKEKSDKKIMGFSPLSFILRRVPLVDKLMFIKHLAVMTRAGLPTTRALNILSNQSKSSYFSRIIKKLEGEVKKGKSLADSMAQHPRVFSPLFSSTVRIGEIGGNLEEVLELLAIQLRKEHDLKSKVRGAMIYPSVIVFAMIVIGIIVMVVVVPKLTQIFQEMNVELPITTRMIIGLSNFIQSNLIFVVGGLLAFIFSIISFNKTVTGKKVFHLIFLNIPLIRGLVVKINTARFARTLSSLLKSGVAIVQALKIIGDSLGNVYFQKALKKAADEVQGGIPLNKTLTENKVRLFPPMVIQMIKVGEETGTSEEILLQLAEFYEKEVDELTKNLSSVIEPVLILLIGGAVGLFAVSIIQPMYMIMDVIE